MQLKRVEIQGKRWYRGPDGKLYPTASSVLDILDPHGKDFIKESDMVRGTLCHEQTAKILMNRIAAGIYVYQPCEDADIEMRVGAIIQYLDKFQLDIEAIESPVLFLGVGMTPDCITKETGPDGQWLRHGWDWKFAETIVERYYFQAELYGRAEQCDKFTILQCNRKGDVFPHRVRPEAERWELIKSAINVRQHLAKKEIKHYV